jgi:hypothetical protein
VAPSRTSTPLPGGGGPTGIGPGAVIDVRFDPHDAHQPEDSSVGAPHCLHAAPTTPAGPGGGGDVSRDVPQFPQ